MKILALWPLFWILCLASAPRTQSFTQQPASVQDSAPVPPEQFLSLASQFVANKEKLGCPPTDCKILVTDFVLQSGLTSPFGIHSVELLSIALTKTDKSLTVLDRSLSQNFLQKERIPLRFMTQVGVARWLARKLNADVVVTGEVIVKGKKDADLITQFAGANDDKQNPLKLTSRFRLESLDLSPIDTLPPLPPLGDTVNGERVYRAGVGGVGLPSCFFMPQPPSTEEARRVHFLGDVMVEALIEVDGKVKPLRILHSAPGALDDGTLRTLSAWKCRPVLLDGKPVPTVVLFEVNFNLTHP